MLLFCGCTGLSAFNLATHSTEVLPAGGRVAFSITQSIRRDAQSYAGTLIREQRTQILVVSGVFRSDGIGVPVPLRPSVNRTGWDV